jgi:hypothetical protein
MKKHPGKIDFFQLIEGKLELKKTELIEKIPESMRFVNLDGKEVPVVKCVSQNMGDHLEIIEYGPKDKFLRSTIARK